MILTELQHDFLSRIAADNPPASGVWADDRAAGLAVYRHAYRARLLDCLREGFEKTWAWIGDEAFEAASSDYIDTHQPRSWTLDAYGDGFSTALAGAFPDDPEIAELAWLERAMHEAFTSPDTEPFDQAAFAAQTGDFSADDWNAMRLVVQPRACQRHVLTNAAAIWHHLDGGIAPPPAMLLEEWTEIIVWRQGLVPCFRSLDEREARALHTIGSAANFDELCETLADAMGGGATTAAQTAGSYLARWIGEGLIAGISSDRGATDPA